MQRQRSELVPIGDALADLDGPVKAIREASPQARHHFTRFVAEAPETGHGLYQLRAQTTRRTSCRECARHPARER